MYSSKLWFSLVMVATICFLALVTLQVLEFLHYSADPTIWPPQI